MNLGGCKHSDQSNRLCGSEFGAVNFTAVEVVRCVSRCEGTRVSLESVPSSGRTASQAVHTFSLTVSCQPPRDLKSEKLRMEL